MLTVAEVARLLDCQPAAVYKLIKSGRLPAVRVTPRMIRIEREDFEEFVRRAKEGER